MDLKSTSTKRISRWLTCLTAFFVTTTSQALDTKRFDAPAPKRAGYLTFATPKNLRFAPARIVADRGALIMPSPVIPKINVKPVETNSSLEQGEFPVFDYSDSADPDPAIPDAGKLEIPKIAPPVELPLADPFVTGNSSSINSTAELIKIFDRSRVETGNSNIVIPFMPPYTVTPENMTVTSRSVYRRINR